MTPYEQVVNILSEADAVRLASAPFPGKAITDRRIHEYALAGGGNVLFVLEYERTGGVQCFVPLSDAGMVSLDLAMLKEHVKKARGGF